MSAKKVIEAIKANSAFLITAHINLEGDALGSELALASLLRKLGKKVFVVNSDKTPANYSFLPGTKMILHHLPKTKQFAVAFILDCPNIERIGQIASIINHQLIINLDHHLGNRNFGQVNWIDTQASSAGEMIYRLFDLMQVKLDKADALNIYTAILTDTGSFRHCNTTSFAFSICSKLLKIGVDPAKIYSKVYENNSPDDVTFVAKIIARLSFLLNNKIAWVKITRRGFKRIKDNPEIINKILDFAKLINTVEAVIIFCQLDNRLIKLSLRSKGLIDVQKIAQGYGGGGHRLASGCTIKGSFSKVKQAVLTQIERLLKAKK